LVKHRTTAVPFAIENTDVVVGETQFFERCFHKQYATVILSGAKLASCFAFRCSASLNMTGLHASPFNALLASLPAELPHHFHRSINRFGSDVERRTETDRVLAGAKRQDTKVEEAMPKFFARFRIGKIERQKYSTAARGGNQRLFRL